MGWGGEGAIARKGLGVCVCVIRRDGGDTLIIGRLSLSAIQSDLGNLGKVGRWIQFLNYPFFPPFLVTEQFLYSLQRARSVVGKIVKVSSLYVNNRS